MRSSRLSLLLPASLMVALFVSPAKAGPIPWSNPAGSAPAFTWSGGHNDTDLFGSPTQIGNSLVFFPSAFQATSQNGIADSAQDQIDVDIDMKAGFNLIQITVSEIGDYSISGTNTPAGNSVRATATLFVTNLDVALPPVVQGLTFNPSMPITTVSSGIWNGGVTANFVPGQYDRFHLTLNNILDATTNANSTSTIDKKFGGIIITIPEPATLGLLLCGVPMVLRRRRA